MELNKHTQKLLADIYEKTGDFKRAYNAHVLCKQLNDSLLNEKNIRRMALMESSYKYEKEIQKYELEQANQKLQIRNQRYIIFFLISATLLIIILTTQLYRSSRLKKKVLKLEVDQAKRKLEYSQKEMTSATLKLIQNAECDSYCIKMLENLEKEMMKRSISAYALLSTTTKASQRMPTGESLKLYSSKSTPASTTS